MMHALLERRRDREARRTIERWAYDFDHSLDYIVELAGETAQAWVELSMSGRDLARVGRLPGEPGAVFFKEDRRAADRIRKQAKRRSAWWHRLTRQAELMQRARHARDRGER